MSGREFKVGDRVKDTGADKDDHVFVVQRIMEPNMLTKLLANSIGRPDVADDPILMNDDERIALPAGLCELVEEAQA